LLVRVHVEIKQRTNDKGKSGISSIGNRQFVLGDDDNVFFRLCLLFLSLVVDLVRWWVHPRIGGWRGWVDKGEILVIVVRRSQIAYLLALYGEKKRIYDLGNWTWAVRHMTGLSSSVYTSAVTVYLPGGT